MPFTMKALSLQNLKGVSDLSIWMIWKQELADYPKGPETKKTLRNNKLHLDLPQRPKDAQHG